MKFAATEIQRFPEEKLANVEVCEVDDEGTFGRRKTFMLPLDWAGRFVDLLNAELPKSQPDIEAQAKRIYDEYPYKKGKAAAIKKIIKALEGRSYDFLMSRTKRFAALPHTIAEMAKPAGEDRYVPYPQTWFNQGHYDNEDLNSPAELSDFEKAQRALESQA